MSEKQQSRWDSIYEKKGIVQEQPIELVKRFLKYVPEKHNTILDHGCGTGRHTHYLAQKKKHIVYAMDESATALSYVQESSRIKKLHASFDYIPLDDHSIGAVVSTYTLHHGSYEQIKQSVSEISRVLKKGGVLCIATLSDKDVRATLGEKYLGETKTRIHVPDLPDSDIPHHFFSDEEITHLFCDYTFIYRDVKTEVVYQGISATVHYELLLKKKI